MPRFRITIEYDGTPFSGWQTQSDEPSVQQALQQAIHRFSGELVRVQGAGRTDAGVHALGQVAHFDLSKDWDPQRVTDAINFHLKPRPAAVLECERISEAFDARFSAIQRRYRYRILNRRSRPAILRDRVWHVATALDAERMHDAAQSLLGHHDFTTFRAAQCQSRSAVKTIDAISVSRIGEEVVLDVAARSFLHNQVRSIMGSLKLVGEGRWSPADLAAALSARDRQKCGAVAPPQGLYLMSVRYPPGGIFDASN